MSDTSPALGGSMLDFVRQTGADLNSRCAKWGEWLNARRQSNVWPGSRIVCGAPADSAVVADEFGRSPRACLNFGSQDYLGLASDARIQAVAKTAIEEHGLHSAGSPVLAGRTNVMFELENRLAQILRKAACAVYATGWAAGFGVLAGLARERDTIVIDALAHNCLVEGAKHATRSVVKCNHNDLTHLAEILRQERSRNCDSGIFVVVESLYSMDSDSPDLRACVDLARQYDAMTILDVAHDFGSMGSSGRGLLDTTHPDSWPDIIMGSFSKTFASNGGFIAANQIVVDYLRFFSPSFTFSNALSPVQCKTALACCDVAFSNEGSNLREELAANIRSLRTSMIQSGLEVGGTPSPIVPVFVGNESLARLTSRRLSLKGLLANLVEFPAVPKGKARFRFQLMRTHKLDAIDCAVRIMSQAREEAKEELSNCQTHDASARMINEGAA